MTTKAERDHLDAVASLGCIISRKMGMGYVPAEIHHVRTLDGQRIKRNHMLVIPLSPWFHRLGPMGEGFHSGSRTWQKIHGTEAELLEEVAGLLEIREIGA